MEKIYTVIIKLPGINSLPELSNETLESGILSAVKDRIYDIVFCKPSRFDPYLNADLFHGLKENSVFIPLTLSIKSPTLIELQSAISSFMEYANFSGVLDRGDNFQVVNYNRSYSA